MALVATLVFLTGIFAAPMSAQAQNRTLSLYNTHTHERLTVTYKRNGRFVQAGLDQLNRFLRDWRRDEVTRIDPDLLDILWAVYREVGASEPIHVVSAYRSPATNNMLRRRSSGVARNSQHTQGRAMDFFIPGVRASRIREAGLRLQQGGVGYYPRSNTPYVHLDTGSVRMWPRMTRSQLARVFPNGRTIHIPADGRPMAGFEIAQRELQRGGRPSTRITTGQSVETARNEDNGEILLPSAGDRSIWSALFGGGNTPTPSADVGAAQTAPAAPVAGTQTQATPVQTATVSEPIENASGPREPYQVASPILPPYASSTEPSLAPSTIAGLSVPTPTPAPTIDDIQIAALGTGTGAETSRNTATGTDAPSPAPGAIALNAAFETARASVPNSIDAQTLQAQAEALRASRASRQTPDARQIALSQIAPSTVAFAAASQDTLPPITRAQQVDRSVPEPGQIAALIEARFAEQRAAQASARDTEDQGAVEFALASSSTAAVQTPQTSQSVARSRSQAEQQVEAQASLLEPGTLSANPDQPAGLEVASAPRFVPPAPQPAPALNGQSTQQLAALPTVDASAVDASTSSNAVAAAFAAQDEPAAQIPAQDAITTLAALDGGTPATATAPPGMIGTTGEFYPISRDMTPALAKVSIRGAQHATLTAPARTPSFSQLLTHQAVFETTSGFSARTQSFSGTGS
ncbi:MAG: DUF882 domain-containing protein [Pseudomonadota bacterium]